MQTVTRILFGLLVMVSLPAFSQLESSFPSQAVSYKVLQDDPKDLNTLWIHVQPVTVDVMQMNAAVGSGLDFTYNPISKLEVRAGIRGNFINAMDLQRHAALQGASIITQDSKREQGQMNLTNSFSRFYQAEAGVFYRIKDQIKDGSSRIVLTDQAVPDRTGFPEVLEVNAKSRRIWGARLGFSTLSTTVSIRKALEDQDLILKGDQGTMLSASGTTSPSGFRTANNGNSLFSTFSSSGFYFGGGFQRVKNLTVKTDRQGIVSNNSILTVYADLIYNPWTDLSAISARRVSGNTQESFDLGPIRKNLLGGRAGFEIRYNQASFVSIGAEVGYRPAIEGQGFYGLFKLGIPTFSFGSKHRKVASNIGKNQSLSK